ncbi:hypothetical protein B0H21DRAFT_371340 [Amylocystis lapponica]|nr:hypothetical protein B0H21DRAFT_371340 [Amylocystis lapponica]
MAQAPKTSLPVGFIQRLSDDMIFYTGDAVRALRNQDDLREFVRELAADPEKGKCIKELSIKGQGNGIGADVCHWIDTIPRLLRGKLPNLKNIHFDSIAWDRSHLNALNTRLAPDLGYAFPTVVTLRFVYCSFAHFRDFEAVLLSFPVLSHLCVENLMGLPADDKETLAYLRMPTPGRTVVRLRSLCLYRYSRMELLFAWVRLTATMTLQSLALHLTNVDTKHEAFVARQLLETLGPMLRHLTIGHTFNRDNPIRGSLFDISHNTRLASLRFLFRSMEPHTVPWASSILAKLASDRVRRIAFDVWLSDEKQLQNAAWSELVECVGALKLQQVEVVHRGELEWRKAYTAIKATFYRLPDPSIFRLVLIDDINHKSTVVY